MSAPEDIEKLANKSGNNFHCKVTNKVKDGGWSALVSPYYMDGATMKPRELDLVAEKHWDRRDEFNRRSGFIAIKLFIECKYFSQPTVFWFSDKDTNSATDWLISNTPLRKDNIFTQEHHYLDSSPKVAKLFASDNKRQIENESMYRAINQSLNALVYLRGGESIVPKPKTGRTQPLTTVEMPVIVCSSFADFYRVEMDNPGTPEPIDDNFQLEINYAYVDSHGNRRSEYFLLDVVSFEKLENYFELLERDKSAIAQIL